jgi:hypothetical protein
LARKYKANSKKDVPVIDLPNLLAQVMFLFPSMKSLEPDDQGLFQVESECIMRIAEQSSGVFLGRCGRYILRNHPCQFNIRVHAGLANRIQRVQKLFCLEAGDAKKLIAKNDRDRDAL